MRLSVLLLAFWVAVPTGASATPTDADPAKDAPTPAAANDTPPTPDDSKAPPATSAPKSPVEAPTPITAPTQEALAALGPAAAYEKGVEAFKAAAYEVAVAYFEHAHKLDPSETFLFNIARAYQEWALVTRSSVHVEQAIYHFRLYVERAPTGADREDAETRAKALESLAMRLAREATAEKTAPESAPVSPPEGKTAVEVTATTERGFTIPPTTSATLLAGSVCAGLGGIMGLLARGAMDDFDTARNTPGLAGSDGMADAAGRVETFGTGANVAFIAGGALVATGLVLWLLEDEAWVANVSADAGGVAVKW